MLVVANCPVEKTRMRNLRVVKDLVEFIRSCEYEGSHFFDKHSDDCMLVYNRKFQGWFKLREEAYKKVDNAGVRRDDAIIFYLND